MALELAHGINYRNLDLVTGLVTQRRDWHHKHSQTDPLAVAAVDLAKRRDDRLLKALSLGEDVLRAQSVNQFGARGLRQSGDQYVESTEYQMWRNARSVVESGTRDDELVVYRWQIAVAAWLAYGSPSEVPGYPREGEK